MTTRTITDDPIARPPDTALPVAEASSAEPARTHGASITEQRTPRLPSLTGLRFPAAVAVLAFHSALPELPLFADRGIQRGYYHLLSQAGGLGVTFFFVLSGFVMTWSNRPGDRVRSFWRRRFVKILPVYYVTCAVALVAMHWGDIPFRQLAAYLTMTQVWVPDYSLNFAVLAPGWSLATEAVFYLVFPLLLARIVRARQTQLKLLLAGTLALVLAIPFLSELLPTGSQYLSNEPTVSGVRYWFDYVLPIARIPDFLIGMLLARLLREDALPQIRMWWAMSALAGCYALSLWSPVLIAQRAVLIVPCALVVVAAAQGDMAGRRSAFSGRRAGLLGEMSFAFYLLHFSVLHVLNVHVLHGPTSSIAAAAAYLMSGVALTLALSWLVYTMIEKPLVQAYGGSRVRGLQGRVKWGETR